MKIICLNVFVTCLFYSCSPPYLLVETSSNQVQQIGKELIYDTSDVSISYHFWENGGVMKFKMYNKTSNPLFINLNTSHLIRNGQSVDYYNNNTITEGKSMSTEGVSFGYIPPVYKSINKSVNYRMKPILEIPPKTYITVDNLRIINQISIAFNVNYSELEIYSVEFDQLNTPLQFRNYVTYDTTPNFTNPKIIENLFWVNKIYNIPKPYFKNVAFEPRNYLFENKKTRTNPASVTQAVNRFYLIRKK